MKYIQTKKKEKTESFSLLPAGYKLEKQRNLITGGFKMVLVINVIKTRRKK